jgi:hypothetical protein
MKPEPLTPEQIITLACRSTNMGATRDEIRRLITEWYASHLELHAATRTTPEAT